MYVCVCLSVRACSHMWLCETLPLLRLSFFLLFERAGPINTLPFVRLFFFLDVDALQTFTCRVKQEGLRSAAQDERCVYPCDYRFDLSTRAEPFVTQTKGGTLQVFRRFMVAPLTSKEGSSRLPSVHLPTL